MVVSVGSLFLILLYSLSKFLNLCLLKCLFLINLFHSLINSIYVQLAITHCGLLGEYLLLPVELLGEPQEGKVVASESSGWVQTYPGVPLSYALFPV